MSTQKRAELGWVLFDWANSAYSLVISTAIFPVYFLEFSNKSFRFWDLEISNASVYAYSVSLAYILVSLISPLLSGIADYGGHRKLFMRIFTTAGSIACMTLVGFIGPAQQTWALMAFMVATFSHAASLVFYDSYLSQIVSVDRADKLSARGYAFGYTGSVILMCSNILMIQNPAWFGLSDGAAATRIAFFSVGIWWILFSQFTFLWLPKDPQQKINEQWIQRGFNELRKAWSYVKQQPAVKTFLLSFFFYSAGVQTVVYLASSFAKEELHFATGELIVVILLLQLVAIAGAYFFAFLSKKTHNLYAMKIMIAVWTGICLLAYFVESQLEFYFLASLVGLVLGGIQSISRSSYSKMIPENHPDITCFFSFYDVIYYVSIVFGTFLFGFINQLTHSMRLSVLALMAFFLISLIFIRKVPQSSMR